MAFFRMLVSARRQELRAEAADREDRAWVIVILPVGSTDLHPKSTLDAVRP
jgi:hypothetical protein